MNTRPVIVIEDDQDDQFLMEEAFLFMGLENPRLYFDSCLSFIEYMNANEKQPLLIICDVNLPMMNGLQLKSLLFKDKILNKKSFPFIFFTTSSHEDNMNLAYSYNAQGYFVKPSNYIEMRDLIIIIVNYWKTARLPITL